MKLRIYVFISGSSLFDIDSQTGRLFLSESLTKSDLGTYSLIITVTDSVAHQSYLHLSVLVTDSEIGLSATHTSLIVVAVLGAVMGVIIILAVVAFIRLRKQVSLVKSPNRDLN